MQLYDSKGQLLSLGRELGKGGEGSVFEVAGRSDLVAKVYHRPVAGDKASKIATMVMLRTDRLLNLAAWPVDVVSQRPSGSPQAVKGLLMPKVVDHREVHTLYSPKSRAAEWQNVGWPFLVHAAANIARAFAVVHEHGHVVGDVNHGNVVVARDARVRLIDCDSFQIVSQGRRYLCEVGVSTHTPAELQGQKLNQVERTPNHDAFGLAVLIFQLLFMGRHPFSGGFLGRGEMSLEKAIQEFRFAYGPNAPARQMRQPPATLALEATSPGLAALFERAFSPVGVKANARPTARQWEAALEALKQQLVVCQSNPAHHLLRGIPKCPWCEIEALSGIRLFQIAVQGAAAGHGTFNVNAVWGQITAVSSPGAAPGLTMPAVTPSAAAVAHGRKRSGRLLVAILSLTVLLAVLFGLQFLGGLGIIVFIFAFGWAVSFVNAASSQSRKDAQNALQAAQAQWAQASQRWQDEAGDTCFNAKLKELDHFRTQYLGLDSQRQQKLQQLQSTARERQLHRYLDRFRIADANVPQIGAGRSAILQSYGIETAADVDYQKVLRVPGFGPTFTNNLVYWRKSLEGRFTYSPSQNIDPADLKALDDEMQARRAKLQQELVNGRAELQRIVSQVTAARTLLRPHVEQVLLAFYQAQADVRAMH